MDLTGAFFVSAQNTKVANMALASKTKENGLMCTKDASLLTVDARLVCFRALKESAFKGRLLVGSLELIIWIGLIWNHIVGIAALFRICRSEQQTDPLRFCDHNKTAVLYAAIPGCFRGKYGCRNRFCNKIIKAR